MSSAIKTLVKNSNVPVAKIAVAGSFALMLSACGSSTDSNVYSGYPVTLSGYSGSKTTSLGYTGQIARHVLHDSLKSLAGKGTGGANPKLKAQMLSYFSKKDKNRIIIAPKSKGTFKISQTNVDQISKGKNLIGKTYKGTISGMPNSMTGSELVTFWIDKASSSNKGVDLQSGYNYPQLISKFIMGAVSYNQAVDNYLDEKLSASKKPNNKPYKKGAPYTGKEHSWDEAFGYFGAPAHAMKLTPKQVYEIAKRGSKSKPPQNALKYADYNKDGKVDLKTEMTFGPAYYAAGSDKGGKTKYLHTITRAYLDGRQLIVDAKGKKLTSKQRSTLKNYASIIAKNWQQVLAEAAHKYAGSVHGDIKKLMIITEAKGDTSKQIKKYIKHWGELKGFALALQTGKSNLGAVGSKLNKLIGFSPVMLDNKQVTDIDRSGNYVRSTGTSLAQYQANMVAIQKLLASSFGIKGLAKKI
tara:strand:- start:50 stop:1456 length:1407 start_codon:yes stop_codon:yes gene_type:complete